MYSFVDSKKKIEIFYMLANYVPSDINYTFEIFPQITKQITNL